MGITMHIYLDLTRRFNDGQLRAVLAGGQAAVLHRIAFMSKDGDWILREEPPALDHVLQVLTTFGARYRYGAPLDVRWRLAFLSSSLGLLGDRSELLDRRDVDAVVPRALFVGLLESIREALRCAVHVVPEIARAERALDQETEA